MRMLVMGAFLAACGTETGLGPVDTPPPAPPPVDPDRGNAPDWKNCFGGWRGQYANLSIDHPHVLPRQADEAGTQRAWGAGLVGAAFVRKVRSHAGLRSELVAGRRGPRGRSRVLCRPLARVGFGRGRTPRSSFSSPRQTTPGWVVDEQIVADNSGIREFERVSFSVGLDEGEYPIELYFAHRASETSGLSFRVLGGDVSICYPDFEEEETESE